MGRIKRIVKDELGVEDVSLTKGFLCDLENAIRDLARRHREELAPHKSRPSQPAYPDLWNVTEPIFMGDTVIMPPSDGKPGIGTPITREGYDELYSNGRWRDRMYSRGKWLDEMGHLHQLF